MNTTSPTLLQRLRGPNEAEWARFVDLYKPLLWTWARRTGLQGAEAADLVQDVFAHLVRELPRFRYDPAKKNFRGWLRTVCLNKWRDRQRLRGAHMVNATEAALAALESSNEMERFWNQEHDASLVRRALQSFQELRGEFEPKTFSVSWEVLVKQRPAAEVAAQFGITTNAVYIAKLRVLARLRQELAEFLE